MTQARDQRLPSQAVTETAEDWFLRLTSGTASERDLEGFRAWRDADASHRAAFEEVRDLWNDIGELQAACAGDASRPEVVDLRRQAKLRRTTPRPVRRLALGGLVAACLALAAVLGADLPTRLQADFHTAVGEQARLALPDGSTVHLNTDSAIALDFSGTERRVTLLHGEALFEVRPDPARPFAVQSLGGRSTAIGTAYAVHDQGEEAVVTVLEGRVRVAAPADAAAAAGNSIDLQSDRQVSYRRGAAPGQVKRVDAGTLLAWRRGLLVIDALPLGEALAEIDRYHPGRILLLGGGAPRETVTARIDLTNIESGIKALAATHGLTVTHLTDYLVIVR